jgi:hypothetical protein
MTRYLPVVALSAIVCAMPVVSIAMPAEPAWRRGVRGLETDNAWNRRTPGAFPVCDYPL